MPRLLVPLAACVFLLTGCVGLWGGSSASSGSGSATFAPEETAQANVRSAIPALEAWYADHGTYQGATLAKLRSTYDASLSQVKIVRATRATYCVEGAAAGAVYSKDGPAAEIVEGYCPDTASAG
jgi:hypothetical protein